MLSRCRPAWSQQNPAPSSGSMSIPLSYHEDVGFKSHVSLDCECLVLIICFSQVCLVTGVAAGTFPETDTSVSDATTSICVKHAISAIDTVYEGDSSKNYDACRIASFTCPYCGANGLSLRSFASHILSLHADPPVPRVNVICPMCIACPEFDANREIDNLKTHWTAFHAYVRNLEAATYRAEPTRTLGTTRRPMLARRTARQPAGVGVNIGGGGATAQPPTVGIATGPSTIGLPPWSADISDVDEMFRMVNLTRHIPTLPHMPITAEMQRVSNQLFQPVANGTGLLPTLGSLRNVVTRNSEYAQPRNSTSGRQTSVATALPQIVRPLRVVSIYPSTDSQVGTPDELEPFEELTEDDSSDVGAFVDDVDVTQEEHEYHRSEMAMTVSDHSVTSHIVCEDSATTAAPSDSEFEFTFSAYEDSETSSNPGDNEGGDSLSLTENKLSPFDRPLSKRDIWKALRSELTSEEFETFKNVLRREPSRDLDENEGDPVAELAGREQEQVKTADNREAQSWLSLVYDVPPLQSFSVGGYWNDKRFLRQRAIWSECIFIFRKMNREMGMSSGTESILDKADIVLAMIRDIGVVPPKGREYSSHGDFLVSSRMLCSWLRNSYSQNLILLLRFRQTQQSAHHTKCKMVLPLYNLLLLLKLVGLPYSCFLSDGESSEDDDVSEQSVRPDEVEFLANDATSRA
ncbi:unnamed protein product [Angiostrongylus costaricensis]|uniref:Zf-Di19 domain-containing protein n=1 Tax=Angiostrongylus costaricensis TaxID=334426 RepID=A0A158PDF5_ANGCS|nr:unnamed protein product [Angiostrongylus costaricensis]